MAVLDAGTDSWTVLVGARDRQGLLAMVSGVLAAEAYDVRRAVVATWLDGAAVEAFEVRGATAPVAETLAEAVRSSFEAPLEAVAVAVGPRPLRRRQLAVAHHL